MDLAKSYVTSGVCIFANSICFEIDRGTKHAFYQPFREFSSFLML
uniref:Uncharacterized protein n=1 Tax=Rhizophora mucronata TaxID=61149 RepID=A0A2P2QVX0_RHIMU